MIRDVSFLGITMVGSIAYLSQIIFHGILLSSSVKLSSCFVLRVFTFLMQKVSFHCSSLSTSKLSFFHVVAS